MLLLESDAKGLRAASISDGVLQAIEIDRADRPSNVGAVAPARAVRTMPGLGAILALVDGTELLLDRGRDKTVPASGEALIVQITRPPRGEKLGIASRAIALTGRVLIHLPFEAGVKFSRRLIVDEVQRAALLSHFIDAQGGWILRRTAGQADPAEIAAEIATLTAEAAALPSVPAPDAFRRLAADNSLPSPGRIVVAGLAARRSAERWCAAFAPSLMPLIEMQTGLFDLHDIDAMIHALSDTRVSLRGGGSLSIEPTEALTVIDVNAGAASNALSVNLAAAVEIARQLRLRHIGGIVVVDFISMTKPRDRTRVMEALDQALADDPAQTHILPMSALGLVEMTRERRGPGLVF